MSFAMRESLWMLKTNKELFFEVQARVYLKNIIQIYGANKNICFSSSLDILNFLLKKIRNTSFSSIIFKQKEHKK